MKKKGNYEQKEDAFEDVFKIEDVIGILSESSTKPATSLAKTIVLGGLVVTLT